LNKQDIRHRILKSLIISIIIGIMQIVPSAGYVTEGKGPASIPGVTAKRDARATKALLYGGIAS
jgi:hypothetical protein